MKNTQESKQHPGKRPSKGYPSPLDESIHGQTASGVLLMFCALLALYPANSAYSIAYYRILELPFIVGFPALNIATSLDKRWFDDSVFPLAKTGILFASLIAGVSGFLWLYFKSNNSEQANSGMKMI